jgi:predicted nucleotidyltransferase
MIKRLFPLTKNKIEILRSIYENKETHLSELSKNLGIHPFSAQKTLKSIKSFLNEKKAGRTIRLSINKTLREYFELCFVIEDYKLESKDKILALLIKNLQEFFSKDKNILSCVIFGSFARIAYGKESDIDLLLIVKTKNDEIMRKISKIGSMLSREINPIIINEREFNTAIKTKEPAIASILEPSQRLLVIGKECVYRKKRLIFPVPFMMKSMKAKIENIFIKENHQWEWNISLFWKN